MTPATSTAPAKSTTKSAATARPGGYAGNLLRVDLTRRTCRAEPWSPETMRELIGGVGLGAMILYRETATRDGKGNVSWDHPDNRLVLATGPLAGLPVWGTGGLTVCTIGAGTNGPTSTQANGFFGTNLKYCGYDAIIVQGQSKDWLYLYINDDVVELRDARPLVGLDTWETQGALYKETGLAGHQLSVYSIGPAGENLVRFAAIQGDYGHVASKNGCGAVMGKKRLKAVAIVKGTKSLRAADRPRFEASVRDKVESLGSRIVGIDMLATWLCGLTSMQRPSRYILMYVVPASLGSGERAWPANWLVPFCTSWTPALPPLAV